MGDSLNIQEIIAEVMEHVRGMWRYRWWAVGAAWVISVLGWFYVYSMPDVYKASAKIYLETETLMDPVFQGLALRDNLEAQVTAVSRALLTRPNLEAVARETYLDLRAQSPGQMEKLIPRLQDSINIRGDTRRNTFEISYEDADRAMARNVVASIVDSFVEDSLQGQGDDAAMTGRALEAEIANHERRLEAAESRLAEFKKDNLGFMPGEGGDYYARLQAALAAVENTQAEMRALRERRDELQRQLAGESPILGGAAGGATMLASCSQGSQIADLEAQLAALQVEFTEKHPRIVSLKETIGILTDRCEQEWQNGGRMPAVAEGETVEANPVYQNLRMLLTN